MIISQSLSTPENFLPEYGGCVPDALEARGEGWSAPFLGWPPNGADYRKRGRGHLTKRRAARLIADSFEKIASRSTSSSATRGVPQRHLRRRNAASVWTGLKNGVLTPAVEPSRARADSQQHLQWPKWGQHYETGGGAGEPTDLPEAKQLMALYDSWWRAGAEEEKTRI